MKVRYAVLHGDLIFNLTSPRYLPEISRHWTGRHPWHDARYEPVRTLMEQMYVDGFNAASGHFERLEADVLANGFRNPIMVSAGGLQLGRESELPPDLETPLVSEYLGGSRLWVAQRHGLRVPCIVNDYAHVLPEYETLHDLSDVLLKFRDKPRTGRWDDRGVYVNDLPYVHLKKPYSLAQQSLIRHNIINRIRTAVREWLDAHDRD